MANRINVTVLLHHSRPYGCDRCLSTVKSMSRWVLVSPFSDRKGGVRLRSLAKRLTKNMAVEQNASCSKFIDLIEFKAFSIFKFRTFPNSIFSQKRSFAGYIGSCSLVVEKLSSLQDPLENLEESRLPIPSKD